MVLALTFISSAAGTIGSALRHAGALVAVLGVVLHPTKEENVKTDAPGAEIGNVDVRGRAAGTRGGLDRVTESAKGRTCQFR